MKKIRSQLQYQYWMNKGLTEEESKIKVSEIQRCRSSKLKELYANQPEKYRKTNTRCIEYWINKGYSEEDAKLHLNEVQNNATKGFQNRKSYWINKGYSEKDAKKMVSKIQIERGIKNRGNKACGVAKTMLYWINKGYTNIDAYQIIKENSQFTLEKCIKKYGEIEGTKYYYDRQVRWLNTMNSKPLDERIEIYRKKLKRSKFYSNESIKIFTFLLDDLKKEANFDFKYHWKDNEYFLLDNENKIFYSYDLTILDLNIIIEYNGHHCHPNKNKLNDDEWKKWKNIYPPNEDADTKYKKDKEKQDYAISKGFKYFIIWSNMDIKDQLVKIKQEIIYEIDKFRNI